MPLQYIPYLLYNWQEKQLLAQECQFISPTHPLPIFFGHMNTKYPCRPKNFFKQPSPYFTQGYKPFLNSLESTSYC